MLTEHYDFVTKHLLWPVSTSTEKDDQLLINEIVAAQADGQKKSMEDVRITYGMKDGGDQPKLWTQIPPSDPNLRCLFKCSQDDRDKTCFYIDTAEDALKRYKRSCTEQKVFKCKGKACQQKNSIGALLANSKADLGNLSFHWLRTEPKMDIDSSDNKCNICKDIKDLNSNCNCLLDEVPDEEAAQNNIKSKQTKADLALTNKLKAIVKHIQDKSREQRDSNTEEEFSFPKGEKFWTTPRLLAFLNHYKDFDKTRVLLDWHLATAEEKEKYTITPGGRDNFLVFCKEQQFDIDQYQERYKNCSHVDVAHANSFFEVNKNEGKLKRKSICGGCSKNCGPDRPLTLTNTICALKNEARIKELKAEFVITDQHKRFEDLRLSIYKTGTPKWKCSSCKEEFEMQVTTRYTKNANHVCGLRRKPPNIKSEEEKRQFVQYVTQQKFKDPKFSISAYEKECDVGKDSYRKWKNKLHDCCGEEEEEEDPAVEKVV